jgi:hypothetical protein
MFILAMSAAGVTAAGCNSSNDDQRFSRKGEVCQTTADCESGLSCVPRSSGSNGICVKGEFKIAQTAKECAIIECHDSVDCCPTPPSNCASLDQQCKQSPGSFACDDFNRLCRCDGSRYACESGRCRPACKTNTDCGIGSCIEGKCVECEDDGQCRNGTVCNSGRCVPPCTSDTECPSFNRCSEGRCVDSGCSSDRECVAATKNVEAKCTDKKCVVPCQTDLECGNPQEYRFYSCIKNQCVYVGCESDKECQLYLGQSAVPGTKHEIVCRDRVTEGE